MYAKQIARVDTLNNFRLLHGEMLFHDLVNTTSALNLQGYRLKGRGESQNGWFLCFQKLHCQMTPNVL